MRLSPALLAAAAVACLASSAAAEDLHVPVGDLSQPAAARDFDHRLKSSSEQFCNERYRLYELNAWTECLKATRAEGLSQLSPEQREALAGALANHTALASSTR